jgi:hypothetical protein
VMHPSTATTVTAAAANPVRITYRGSLALIASEPVALTLDLLGSLGYSEDAQWSDQGRGYVVSRELAAHVEAAAAVWGVRVITSDLTPQAVNP